MCVNICQKGTYHYNLKHFSVQDIYTTNAKITKQINNTCNISLKNKERRKEGAQKSKNCRLLVRTNFLKTFSSNLWKIIS